MLKKQAERDKIQIGTRPYLYKFEKDRLYLNQGVPEPSWTRLLGQSALAMCQSALQECQQALLGAGLAFEFWSNLDSFLRVFEPGIAPRRVFNSYSKN